MAVLQGILQLSAETFACGRTSLLHSLYISFDYLQPVKKNFSVSTHTAKSVLDVLDSAQFQI